MPQGNPQPGEKYLHFKNRPYEVTAIAYHSETMEKYVVYRQLYGEGETFIRPYEMFISEVDREKYPGVTQKYRFQYQGTEEEAPEEETAPAAAEPEDTGTQEPTASDGGWVDRILDASTPEERYDIVCSIHDGITDGLIDDLATVLDLSIPEGDVQERYRQLKDCMKTIRKYESDRLRPDP